MWWITLIRPRVARTRWPNPPFELRSKDEGSMSGHARHASVRYGERDRSGDARNVATGEYFRNRRLLLLVNPDEFSERSVLQLAAQLFGDRPSRGPAQREDAGEFKRATICEF